jgi:hypothetical protein
MPSTSETGHAKNVANFSKLIEVCKGFGTKYNPSKAALTLTALEAKLASCIADLQEQKNAEQAEKTARNNRLVAFKERSKFSTKLLAAIKASDVSDETIANATSINKKIRGEKITDTSAAKTSVEADTTVEPKTISTAQLSYTSIVDHFKKYQTLLTSLGTNYAPNENELKLATLTTQIAAWETLNNQVDVAETASKNALIKRDKNFYSNKTGIPDLAADVKDYIKSVFGAGSPEHKMVTKITFSKPKSK